MARSSMLNSLIKLLNLFQTTMKMTELIQMMSKSQTLKIKTRVIVIATVTSVKMKKKKMMDRQIIKMLLKSSVTLRRALKTAETTVSNA